MFPYNLCIAKILIIIHRSPGEAEMSARAEERESSNCGHTCTIYSSKPLMRISKEGTFAK